MDFEIDSRNSEFTKKVLKIDSENSEFPEWVLKSIRSTPSSRKGF